MMKSEKLDQFDQLTLLRIGCARRVKFVIGIVSVYGIMWDDECVARCKDKDKRDLAFIPFQFVFTFLCLGFSTGVKEVFIDRRQYCSSRVLV
ncbi:MAG: hypothetical protein AAFU03_01975 [Bacteroidota bacterium]